MPSVFIRSSLTRSCASSWASPIRSSRVSETDSQPTIAVGTTLTTSISSRMVLKSRTGHFHRVSLTSSLSGSIQSSNVRRRDRLVALGGDRSHRPGILSGGERNARLGFVDVLLDGLARPPERHDLERVPGGAGDVLPRQGDWTDSVLTGPKPEARQIRGGEQRRSSQRGSGALPWKGERLTGAHRSRQPVLLDPNRLARLRGNSCLAIGDLHRKARVFLRGAG